jgi:hypothetical protein
MSEWATIEGVMAKSFTLEDRKHFPQYRGQLPEPDFHRLDTACFAGKQIAHTARH